jgi:hypothetical protein
MRHEGGRQKTERREKMDWNAISAMAGVGAFGAAVAGIGLIFLQIRRIGNQISASSCATLYGQMIEIDRFFVQHQDLKAYIYKSKAIAGSDPAYDSVRSLAEMMVDLMEHLYVQKGNLPDRVYKPWLQYFASIYDNSPIVREHLNQSGDWYPRLRREIGRE